MFYDALYIFLHLVSDYLSAVAELCSLCLLLRQLCVPGIGVLLSRGTVTDIKQMEGKVASAEHPRGVPLSPKLMVDSVADWPLHRVVDHLRNKEKDDKDVDVDCRLFHTSGIRLFNSIIGELAENYSVSRGKMCRWLSYHGIEIARCDKLLNDLLVVHNQVRRVAIENNSPAIAGIQESLSPYMPLEEDGKRVSFYVYNSWVLSAFNKLAEVCGVSASQVTQVFILRSVLTCDLPLMMSVAGRIQSESDWWDKWVKYRIGMMDIAVALWGSG
jgi:hypothetical protein